MSKKVMVVDDSGPIRKFVMFALRAQGYAVFTALDGQDALEQLARTQVDLIITDLTMPKLDGIGLIKALRQIAEYAEVPIIVLSALQDECYITEGLSSGADAYLTKPFDSRRIQYEVSKFLN